VTVFAGGPNGKSVLAYDAATGKLAWSAGNAEYSYCSLHLATLGGVEQLLINTDQGMSSFKPDTGEVLWEHAWAPQKEMARVVQPALLEGGDVLIGTPFNMGLRRVGIARDGSQWTTKEVWTTKAISPYYNDLVIHRGHLYGFDANYFVCVSLEDVQNAQGTGRDAKPKWKARGYGSGQVLLLPDQDLLVVLSEKGDVALLEANPAAHKELARFKAIEGKTWNHPVIAHGKLFVRNGEEIACFQLEKK
jgi:outer membrane protein assembly factor BamB